MSKKIVVALGGNAILSNDPTAEGQQKAVRESSKHLATLVKEGHQLVVSHGNGPQVGNLLLQQVAGESEKNPVLPLDTLGAMTQGEIGYWLQNILREELLKIGIDKPVASVITQSVVSEDDPAFENLTKPVGPFVTEEEAKAEMEKTGDTYVEDAGRGWRKVVASPKPISIVEYPVIDKLINSDFVTISTGGGGIPVVDRGNGVLEGVEAVIDKDLASAILADQVDADTLIILTGVDNVYVNFNQPDQEKLENVTIEEMRKHIADNQFAPGSMLPKVEAAIDFVEKGENRTAVITSLENVESYLNGGSATVISK